MSVPEDLEPLAASFRPGGRRNICS
jgi:hypothetical protein